MNLLKKTVGFMAVFCVIPAAIALTARPSVVGTASSRLPTMTAYINAVSSSGSSSTSNLLDNVECIDAYTACLKGGDVCGANFEECTTKVLFHAQMPKCLSTLAQCSASGVNALFGTSSTTALSNVASRNEHDEVTDYTYPTDGSVLGQMITGAAISNMYDTSDCVRRYTSCLQRDNVCGSEFELCTTNTEFRKQMVFCDSTLARCQAAGKIELFGSTSTTTNPTSDSRVGIMIAEGAALAAVNAVSTCYTVVDQCILNACAANPYKCISGSSRYIAYLADAINSGDLNLTSIDLLELSDTFSNSETQGYIRNACLDTIGANKYCYATFLGNGMMPTSSQLSDPDNQEMIFDDAYAARMNASMRAKINDVMQQFDSAAKSSCSDTISSCVMRVCGGGNGAACYSLVFGDKGNNSINGGATYEDIKTGCEAIVNTDLNCQYAAANPDDVGGYVYTYNQTGAFDVLFPKFSAGGFSNTGTTYGANSDDPIGVIASLNASLATSYSDAAIAQMRTQCENVAKSCVKSMCGDEYANCYRNRTDIYSSLTNTGTASFDNSMNKVGGVLDYTVVLGLCMDTVKNANVCQEHLAIETAKMNSKKPGNLTSAWGAGTASVRQGWVDAGSSVTLSEVTADQVQATDFDGNPLCRADDGSQGVCNTVTASGQIYDEPVYITYNTYAQNLAVESLFSTLLYDIEKEAQAIYNSKLTQEQNMCLASNAGGLLAKNDTGATFMWAKLRSNRVPDDYTVMGLERNNFVASNDLYGSFCAVKVTMQSDDTRIQTAMKDAEWGTAYFAVGDTFSCGSWIPAEELEEIANAVAADATADKAASQRRTRTWLGVLGGLGGALGGAYLGQGIADGSILGGLTGKKASGNTKTSALNRVAAIERIINNPSVYANEVPSVTGYMSSLATEARSLGVDSTTINMTQSAVTAWATEYNATHNSDGSVKRNSTNTSVNTTNYNNAVINATSQLGTLKTAIDVADGQSNSGGKNSWIAPTVGAVVTGAAGATILTLATRDIQNANLSAEQQAAYDEWMNNVGRHLKCYIGVDEAGEYGDIISVSMD